MLCGRCNATIGDLDIAYVDNSRVICLDCAKLLNLVHTRLDYYDKGV